VSSESHELLLHTCLINDFYLLECLIVLQQSKQDAHCLTIVLPFNSFHTLGENKLRSKVSVVIISFSGALRFEVATTWKFGLRNSARPEWGQTLFAKLFEGKWYVRKKGVGIEDILYVHICSRKSTMQMWSLHTNCKHGIMCWRTTITPSWHCAVITMKQKAQCYSPLV